MDELIFESNLQTAPPKLGLPTHHSDKLPSVRFFKRKLNECTFKLDDASYLVLEVVSNAKSILEANQRWLEKLYSRPAIA